MEELLNEVKEETETQEKKPKKKKSKFKKILIITISVVVVLGIAIGAFLLNKNYIVPNNQYKQALSLWQENKYDEAIAIFENIEDFKDALDKKVECKYAKAEYLISQNKYDEAIEVFTNLGAYSNSRARVFDTGIEKAVYYSDNNKHVEAYKQYASVIENYSEYTDEETLKQANKSASEEANKAGEECYKQNKYEDAVEYYYIAKNDRRAHEIEYEYVKDHYEISDSTAIKFLEDLKNYKYMDSVNLYWNLCEISIELIGNTSLYDTTNDLSIASYHKNYDKPYYHFKISGGYNNQAIKLTIKEEYGYKNDGLKYSTTSTETYVNNGEWYTYKPKHTGYSVYESKVTIINTDTQEVLATKYMYTY